MPVKIVYCSCNTGKGSEYQDAAYGKGHRVANETGTSEKSVNKGFKCTCCGKLHS